MTDQNRTPKNMTYISTVEPQPKPPPALETGVLKWIRENLFSSVMNSILTVVGLFVVVYTVYNIAVWIIETGNWLAITANIRQYMVGSFPPEYMWRIQTFTLFSVFVIGMAVAVWVKQIARAMAVTIAIFIALVLLLPPITKALVDLPEFYMLAGTGTIQTGSSTERPISQVAFIGKAGEEVRISFADNEIESETTLANLAGYMSVPANTLRNAAANRLTAIAEQDDLQAKLDAHNASEIPILTDSQVEAYTALLDGLVIPDPILETYAVNSFAVQLTMVDAATGEALGEPIIINSENPSAAFVLPQDGWYILEKVSTEIIPVSETDVTDTEATNAEATPAVTTQDIRNVSGLVTGSQNTATADAGGGAEGSVALLEVNGIYPVRLSSIAGESGFVAAYSRATDFFRVSDPVPRNATNSELPFVVITGNQYRGDRSFGDFMRAYVAPFFDNIKTNVTIFLVFGILGYAAVILIESSSDPQTAARLTTYALISIPVLMWIFVNGFHFTTAVALGGVVALALQCLAVFRLGQRNGWRGWRPDGDSVDGAMLIIIAAIVSYVALILMMDRVNGGSWAGWILRLGFIPLAIAALAGSSLSTPGAEDEISGTSVLMPFLIAGLIIGAIFFSGVGLANPEKEWLFAASNPDNWSGLLLTMVLTIYGIIVAFPIGIGLALGRRSDLPLIKYLCTAYIELIRGSPFITVLFFARLLIPLIRPELAAVPNGYRAIIATIAFSAAYMAENVRGGLQSLPPGQNEAAKALGLSAWQGTILITLPQALRAVIPALVGQFISLFKDTSLVTIISLIDLTGVVNSMAVQPEFVGTRLEGLLFISIIYFVISYVLSYISRLLEASGSGATRRMA